MRPPRLGLLLLCCLGAAAPPPDSFSQLAAPGHPKIHLHNEKQVLSWDSPSPSAGGRPVVYRVQYKFTTDKRYDKWYDKWFDVTVDSIGVNCTQITATECDFTAGLSKGFPMYFNVFLRVRAELGELTSAWATVPWFQHCQNVTIGPPTNVLVTPGQGTLIIRLSSPFKPHFSEASFQYYVHYWEKRRLQQFKQVKGPFTSGPILLDGLKPFQEYCLQVKAELHCETPEIVTPGHLSNTTCYETTADASTKLQQVILISVGIFSALLVLAGGCFFLVLKYRGLVKYWFHAPPSIPLQIEEYLKDPAQPILEALDKDISPKDEAWDSVSIISFPDKEREDVL